MIAHMDVLDLALDPARGPLYTQVVDAVAAAIASGGLEIGERLPSERDLAQQLGMSRTTAVNAYRELEARGLVRRQVGRGTVVAAQEQPIDAPFAWRGKVALGAERTCDPVFRSLVGNTAPGTISLAPGVSALDCFPLEPFRRLLDEVLRRGAGESVGLSPTEGHPRLRRALGKRFGVGPERVLVLAGAQQGLDLVARCLIEPGDVVVMDRPGYLGAIQVFRAAGARLVGWDASCADIDQLEDVLVRYRPKFLYTTPSFGNPTGRTLPLTVRHDLLRLAARYHLPIVEDDPYSELYFKQPPPPSLRELDEHQLVIYIGTFSKTLAAGLRLGWLVAAEAVVDQLAFIKGRSDLFTSTPTQLVLAEMLTTRVYDTHLKVLRAEHARRYEALVSALRRSLPPGLLGWHPVEGGLYLWCRLQQPIDARLLLQQALAAGVSFVTGESFYGDGCGRYELRLCFAAASPADIKEAVHRLTRLFQPAAMAALREVDGTRPLV